MQEYTAPAEYVASASASMTSTAKPTGTGTTTPKSGEKGGSNTGAIVGGIIGAIAVIGATVGFLFYRRRQQRNTHLHTPVKSSDYKESGSSGSGNNNNSSSVNRNKNEEELRRMQNQFENQQQQLELQRQLLALQQQQTVTSAAVSQPAMVQQYQDSTGMAATPYGYQPLMYYPAVSSTLQTVHTVPNTSAAYSYSTAIPAVSGGHSEMYQQTTEPNFVPSPVVYMPADYILPPATSSPVISTTAASSGVGVGGGDTSSPYAVGSALMKGHGQGQVSGPQSYVDGSGGWTEKPQPNNPHTIIE